MATKVMMEALSPTMEEGRLAKWLKAEGDTVANGDVLAEVETDKAIMELVARGDGVLRKRLIGDDSTAPVGQLIGIIAGADEDISALLSGAPAAAAAPATAPAEAAPAKVAPAAPAAPAASAPAASAPAAPTPPTAPEPPAPAAEPTSDDGRVKASPLARRMASDQGVSLANVVGTGPSGRVIRRDIEAAASAPRAASAAAAAPAAATASSKSPSAAAPAKASGKPPAIPVAPAMQIDGDVRDVTLTQMRKTIARRLGESIGPIPTFYLTSEIDMTTVGDMRTQMAAAGDAFKVSVNDIVMKAVAVALAKHPECNAHWLGDTIRYFAHAHIGMAVATDDGLIVPVIRDADRKGLGEIGREARELAGRARERKLKPEEYTGSTFSVSNLGMFGIDQFTAIINPPEAGILAVGATETKPVWIDGAFVPRQRMRVTMSCDHRVIDGAVGARFLQTVRHLLENPFLMLY
jgi:pyruvate dehydrogenase E2 component (dihydrolipoamide acetyltransferase)